MAPDWVCELLSPSTAKVDKIRKMPLCARYGVLNLWLIDPAAKILEVYGLEGGRWVVLSLHAERDRVRAEPFEQIEIDLGNLWLEESTKP